MFRRNTIFAVLLTAFLISIAIPLHSQAEPTQDVRIVVLPLNGDSSGDFGYLSDSIRTMLSSRLAVKDGIEVVDAVLSADQLALLNTDGVAGNEYQQILDNLSTDYLVSGALYALQTGLKIQVNVSGKDIKASGGGTFTSLAVSEDHILESVEHLVEDIAVRALGVTGKSPALAASGSSGTSGFEGFGTEHPEKAFKKGVYGGAITAEGGMVVKSLGVRRSSELPLILVSMTSGDLNGDGNLEVVAASRTSVEIYRFDDKRFVQLGAYAFSNDHKIHAVNIADFDGDGRAEVYVSANKGRKVASAIFQWDVGTGLQPLLTDIDWYLRPMVQPGAGLILAGQRGSVDPRTGYVAGNVVTLALQDGFAGLEQEAELPLPKNVRLFDFIWADVDGNGSAEIVAIDSREKLLVYDNTNSLLFVSENDYGGSRNFFGPSKSAVTSPKDLIANNSEAESERPMLFIPTRLLAADLNGDGRQEIIVGNNKRTTPVAMVNFREYDGGSVVGLSWTEETMVEVWKTNRVEGYIADYNFMDLEAASSKTGDAVTAGTALYITQVPDKHLFGFTLKNSSKLLRYSLDVEKQKQNN